MHIEHAARTHVGRRSNNEDSLLDDAQHGVFAVADGMGGYEGGEVASQLVVDTLRSFFSHNADDGDLTWPWGVDNHLSLIENQLCVAVRMANRAVLARRRGRLAQMGSTVVALAVDGPRVALAHLGDSRIYRLRSGMLEQLTRDHSLVEELRSRGMNGNVDGIGHVVTRAVGVAGDAVPELRRELVCEGDTFLLCSDGVTDAIGDESIRKCLSHDDVNTCCDMLIRSAFEAGGSDNITALVLRFR